MGLERACRVSHVVRCCCYFVCLFVFWPNEATAFQPRSQLSYFIATQDSAEVSAI